jgi:trans-aconitate methyltransferase
VVVDKRSRDRAGRLVPYSSVDSFPAEADVVFACHVLEHLPALDDVLAGMRRKLRPGGFLIVLVPSFSNEGWRAGRHRHERFGPHLWTFGLSSRPAPMPLSSYANIDELLSGHLTVLRAAYVGDDSIYCLCRRDG